MYLYNSASRMKEEFKPNHPDIVKMYTCGPTVYHFAHIGNLRSYIMEDVLEKYLRYIGYNVKRVMNITDVGHLTSDADEGEDKMLKGARREHKTVMEIAKFYTDAFFDDCRKLNIKRPDVVQPATGCIDEYIKIITKLLDTGYAYIEGGNVYFDTSKLENYYVFGNMEEESLAVGVRDSVEEDENKRSKSDFVLWFTKSKFDDQELKWDSPWGVGYPGWHIECSGISIKHLGGRVVQRVDGYELGALVARSHPIVDRRTGGRPSRIGRPHDNVLGVFKVKAIVCRIRITRTAVRSRKTHLRHVKRIRAMRRGIPSAHVTGKDIERGVVRLNLERLIEISNLLDVPITTLLDHCSQNVDTEAAPPSEDARIEQLLEMFRVAGPETADLMFALCETTFGKMEHRRKRSKK